ncbi:MAG: hypothetical protein EHM12_08020 [Dehalococcoidia bacterium]|nr:MAG: hypothetical protein EHM12_08020 [Dehalococcoidia bacterium]
MVIKTKKEFCVLYICNILHYIFHTNVEYDNSIFECFESNSYIEIQNYINENLFLLEDPFQKSWDKNYPNAQLRLFMEAIDGNRLSINMPEFIFYLSQQNISLILDEEYNGVWAYLQYIEEAHRAFLEKDYNAKFETR